MITIERILKAHDIGPVMIAYHALGVSVMTHYHLHDRDELEELLRLANGHLKELPRFLKDICEKCLISDTAVARLLDLHRQLEQLLTLPEKSADGVYLVGEQEEDIYDSDEPDIRFLNKCVSDAHKLVDEQFLPALRNALNGDEEFGDVTVVTSEIADKIDEAEERCAEYYTLGNLYGAKAFVYFLFGNLGLAEREYATAIRLDDRIAMYPFGRAHVYVLLNDMPKANADMDEADRRNNRKTIVERSQPYREVYNRIGELFESEQKPPLKAIPADLIALMAFLENRPLLDKVIADDPTYLNGYLSSVLSDYNLTPLYFLTSVYVFPYMQEPLEMIRHLVALGADPNKPAADGSTPLWNQAADSGSVVMMQLLLELGADPNRVSLDDAGEKTYPLTNCLLPTIQKSFTETFDDGTPYFDILPYSKKTCRKAMLLLEHGANPNLTAESLTQFPPLRLAIDYGGDSDHVLELIECLLKHGADPNFLLEDGTTLLQYAANENKRRIGELLLQYGARILPDRPDIYDFLRASDNRYELMPASNEASIAACNANLKRNRLPEMPDDYAAFLLRTNGFAFNSVELYGTATIRFGDSTFVLNDILTESKTFRYLYVNDFGDADDETHIRRNPLCFGRQDGDYYTYNPDTRKYQLRSHESITDILGEYDSFEELFWNEIRKFL
jgi:ankyrin repeat protein